MFNFEYSIMIDLPAEEVFDYVTNPANDMQWQNGLVLSELTSQGPLGIGSTIRSVSKFMGREVDATADVTAYEAPTRFCAHAVSGPMDFDMCQTYESQNGGTLLTFTGQVEVGGFFKVAEGMVAKQLDSQMNNDLSRLKAVLEG